MCLKHILKCTHNLDICHEHNTKHVNRLGNVGKGTHQSTECGYLGVEGRGKERGSEDPRYRARQSAARCVIL